jgi:hypothetical protein
MQLPCLWYIYKRRVGRGGELEKDKRSFFKTLHLLFITKADSITPKLLIGSRKP